MPSNWTSEPTDITNGRYINLTIQYSVSGNNYVFSKISWVPNGTSSLQDVFRKTKQSSTSSENAVTLKIGTTTCDTTGKTLVFTAANNSVSNISITSSAEYLQLNFSYFYTTGTVNYRVDIKNVKIPKPNKYKNNVVFTQEGIKELITNIKKYPVISISATPEAQWVNGQPSITVTHGDSTKTTKVNVGSNIKFKNNSGGDLTALGTNPGNQSIGTFRVSINNNLYEVPIKGLTGTGGTFSITASSANKLVDSNGTAYAVGAAAKPVYFSGGIPVACSSTVGGTAKPVYMNSGTITVCSSTVGGSKQPIYMSSGEITACSGTVGGTDTPVYMNSGTITACSYTIKTSVPANAVFTDTASAANDILKGSNSGTQITYTPYTARQTGLSFYTGTTAPNGTDRLNLNGYFYATRVYNAVFNDYAECRTTIDLTPGHVVIDQDDGSLVCSTTRLQPGAQVISDTYGSSMGETDTAKTHLAVAGRVLVYTYQPRENYHAGMAVCSAPDGTVDIMTREEIRNYPDCMVGIVSEIPQYETWGSNNVKVDGRIWIKVK